MNNLKIRHYIEDSNTTIVFEYIEDAGVVVAYNEDSYNNEAGAEIVLDAWEAADRNEAYRVIFNQINF